MSVPTRDTEWAEDRLDLSAYLRLLGLSPDDVSAADTTTLARLQRAHQQAIPFANTDILLGRGIDLDLGAIQRKLVTDRRGGYCHEHNLLFAAALTRLGYPVTRVSGRVRTGRGTALRPRTHMTLLVTVAGAEHLVDVGFGGNGPLEPVPLFDGAESTQDGWAYRLRQGPPDGWLLRLRIDADWCDLYSFGVEPAHPVDYTVATHYTSTSPHSPFVRRLRVTITRPDARLLLDDRCLDELRPHGTAHRGELDDGAFATALGDVFRLHLPAPDRTELTRLTSRKGDKPDHVDRS